MVVITVIMVMSIVTVLALVTREVLSSLTFIGYMKGHDVVGHVAGILDVLVDGACVPDPHHHVRCVGMFDLYICILAFII
jgi:hypothetical protein